MLNGGQTVVMDAGAFGTGFGIDTIFGNEGEVDTLQISGSSIDIGDIQFRFWDSSDFLLLGGTDGDDFIAATEVRDTMAGQAGTDEFAFNGETVGKNLWRDSIIDFVAGEDIINLSAIDANGAIAGDGVFSIVSAFTNTPGQLRVTQDAFNNTTLLSGDINGDSKTDFQIEVNGLVTFTVDVDLIL